MIDPAQCSGVKGKKKKREREKKPVTANASSQDGVTRDWIYLPAREKKRPNNGFHQVMKDGDC